MSAQNKNIFHRHNPANDNCGMGCVEFSRPADLSNKVVYSANGLSDVRMRLADVHVKHRHRPAFIQQNRKTLVKLSYVGKKLQKVQKPDNCDMFVLDELFFVAHQIRGQGGSFGFSAVSEVADILCLLIEEHKKGNRKAFLAIRKTINVLEELLTNTTVR